MNEQTVNHTIHNKIIPEVIERLSTVSKVLHRKVIEDNDEFTEEDLLELDSDEVTLEHEIYCGNQIYSQCNDKIAFARTTSALLRRIPGDIVLILRTVPSITEENALNTLDDWSSESSSIRDIMNRIDDATEQSNETELNISIDERDQTDFLRAEKDKVHMRGHFVISVNISAVTSSVLREQMKVAAELTNLAWFAVSTVDEKPVLYHNIQEISKSGFCDVFNELHIDLVNILHTIAASLQNETINKISNVIPKMQMPEVREKIDEACKTLFKEAFKYDNARSDVLNCFDKSLNDKKYVDSLRKTVLNQAKEIAALKNGNTKRMTLEEFRETQFNDNWTAHVDTDKCPSVKAKSVPVRDSTLFAPGDHFYETLNNNSSDLSLLIWFGATILKSNYDVKQHDNFDTLTHILQRIIYSTGSDLSNSGFKDIKVFSKDSSRIVGYRPIYKSGKNAPLDFTYRDNDTYGAKSRRKHKTLLKHNEKGEGMLGRDVEYYTMEDSLEWMSQWDDDIKIPDSLTDALLELEYDELFPYDRPDEPSAMKIDEMLSESLDIIKKTGNMYPQLLHQLLAERQLSIQHIARMNRKGVYFARPLYHQINDSNGEKRKAIYGVALHSPCHSVTGNESNRVVIYELWNQPLSDNYLNIEDSQHELFLEINGQIVKKYITCRYRELSFNKCGRYWMSTQYHVLIRDMMLRHFSGIRVKNARINTEIVPLDVIRFDSDEDELSRDLKEILAVQLFRLLWILAHNISNKMEQCMATARALLLAINDTTIDYNYSKPAEDLASSLRNNCFHNYVVNEIYNIVNEDKNNRRSFMKLPLYDELWMLMFPYGNPLMSMSMNAVFLAQLTEKLKTIEPKNKITSPIDGDVCVDNNAWSEPSCVFSGQLLILLANTFRTNIVDGNEERIIQEWNQILNESICVLFRKGTKFVAKEMRTMNPVYSGMIFINELLDVSAELNIPLRNLKIGTVYYFMIACRKLFEKFEGTEEEFEEKYPKSFFFLKYMYTMSSTVKVGEHNKCQGRNIIVMSYSMLIFQHILEKISKFLAHRFNEISIGLTSMQRREFMIKKSSILASSLACLRESADITKYHLTVNIRAMCIALWLALKHLPDTSFNLLLYTGYIWSRKELYVSQNCRFWNPDVEDFNRPTLDELSTRSDDTLESQNVPLDLLHVVQYYRDNKGNDNCIKIPSLMGMGMMNITATFLTCMPLVMFKNVLGLDYILASSDDSVIQFIVNRNKSNAECKEIRDLAHGLTLCASLNPSRKNLLTRGRFGRSPIVEYNSDVMSDDRIIPNSTRALTSMKPDLSCSVSDIGSIYEASEQIRTNHDLGNSICMLTYELIHISRFIHQVLPHQKLGAAMIATAETLDLPLDCVPASMGGKYMNNSNFWTIDEFTAAARRSMAKNKIIEFSFFINAWSVDSIPDAESNRKGSEYIHTICHVKPRRTMGRGVNKSIGEMDRLHGIIHTLQRQITRVIPLS